MDSLELDQINNYLAGNLSEADSVTFETRIIRDSRLRAEVALSRDLREGLADLRATGELEQLLHRRTAFWHRPAFSLAASAVAVLASLVALASYRQLDDLREGRASRPAPAAAIGPATATQVAVLRLMKTRSASGEAAVAWRVDASVGQLDLRIDAGLEPAPIYAFELSRIEGATDIPIVTSAVPVTDGEVAVKVNAALLPPGRYEVALRAPTGEASRFGLDVIAGD
jgi:hypothetical protein